VARQFSTGTKFGSCGKIGSGKRGAEKQSPRIVKCCARHTIEQKEIGNKLIKK